MPCDICRGEVGGDENTYINLVYNDRAVGEDATCMLLS